MTSVSGMVSADERRAKTIRREFSAVASSIGEARDAVRSSLQRSHVADAQIADVLLAVSELVSNALEHGDGAPISLIVESSERLIVAAVTSTGPEISAPVTWESPEAESPRGRGLTIVRAIADQVTVETNGAASTVTCRFERR